MKLHRPAAMGLALLLCFALPLTALAKEPDPPKLTAPAWVLLEPVTGRILLEQEGETPRAPASLTKMMVLLLAMERLDAGTLQKTDLVTASDHACGMGGSQIWLEPGEQMTVDDLMKAVAVGSANDAAVALAEHLGKTEAGCVALMNERAKALGMTGTTFKNASGLDAPGHVSTAGDLGILAAELLSHPGIQEYTTLWMEHLREGKTQLVNTNRLVRFYKGTVGLKTGTTKEAGFCLCGAARRRGLTLVAVVMGAENDGERVLGAKKLLDYGFASYAWTKPPECPPLPEEVRVLHGETQSITPQAKLPEGILTRRGQPGKPKATITLAKTVEAPVQAGQPLGEVVWRTDGVELCRYPLCAPETVPRITFQKALGLFWAALMGKSA